MKKSMVSYKYKKKGDFSYASLCELGDAGNRWAESG